MKVDDLDILRPEKRIIRLAGKDIDISFIPCGITFEIDNIVQELKSISKSNILENSEDTKKAFDLSIKMCVAFCTRKNPEMDYDWFCENVDVMQIKVFANAIQETLIKAYSPGVNVPSKNLKAPKKKSQ